MNLLIWLGYIFLALGLVLSFAGIQIELDKKYTVPSGSHIVTVQNGYKIDWHEMEGFGYKVNPGVKVKVLTIMSEEEINKTKITKEPPDGQGE
jgi:hypothetical protein